jgi:hypothetical protein
MATSWRPQAVAIAAASVLAGCSGDPYGTLLCARAPGDTLTVEARAVVRQVRLALPPGDGSGDVGMGAMQSLYFGEKAGTRSDILVNFDFDAAERDTAYYPDSLLDPAQVRRVRLVLNLLRGYWSAPSSPDSVYGPDAPAINVEVHQLPAPFDPSDYADWPGRAVASEGTLLSIASGVPAYSTTPQAYLAEADVLAWIRGKARIGMVISPGAGSTPGLFGSAARELRRWSEIDPFLARSAVGPSIVVDFEDQTISSLVIEPVNDTSTFDQVAVVPPGELLMQTGLHSYPVISYDAAAVLDGVCIYELHAQLTSLACDPIRFGECLDLAFLDSTRIDLSQSTIPNLNQATTWLSACPDQAVSPCTYQATNWSVGWVGPVPPVVHVLPNFNRVRSYYNSALDADIYFTQTTLQAPGAVSGQGPKLLFITGVQ